jgi:beta-galactosidase
MVIAWSITLAYAAVGRADSPAPLPPGVKVVWDMQKASRETTPTRERICINGLWRFQPAEAKAQQPPSDDWGYFKVPGPWPDPAKPPYANGGESQELHRAAKWQAVDMKEVDVAWYQREVAVPKDWAGRTVLLEANYVDSYARVFLDNKPVGEIQWPGGELDLTAAVKPGQRQTLSVLVAAKPRDTDIKTFLAKEPAGAEPTARQARQAHKSTYRGLVGDVYLASRPAGAHIEKVKANTSVRKSEIELDVAVKGLRPSQTVKLVGHVLDSVKKEVKRLEGPAFEAKDLREGRYRFTTSWQADKLWDVHTPQNQYDVRVDLEDATGKVLDEFAPVRDRKSVV